MNENNDEKTLGRIAFIGLGSMGLPMATRLLERGHQVTVVPHRSQHAVQALAKLGAVVAESPREAGEMATVIITMLPNDDVVQSVLFGPDGAAESAHRGTIVIDMSTISPASAIRISEQLHQCGMGFLDAPVSGGPTRAGTGELAIMIGGEENTLAKVRPILDDLAASVFHVGQAGAGQIIKACNNLIGAACMLADAEALALANAHGIDPAIAREVILAGTGANWQLDKTVPLTVLNDDYSPRFALALLNKDLGIAGAMASAHGLPALVGDLVRSVYGDAQAKFGGDHDFSSVYRLYEPS